MNNFTKLITYLSLLIIMMPYFKPTTANFSYSDGLFLISFILIIIFENKKIKFDLFNNNINTLIYYLGVLFLILGFGISSIGNGNNLDFLKISIQYIMLLLIIPLVLKNSGIKIKKAVYIVLISMSATVLLGVFSSDYYIGGRMGSLFNNPNTLAKNIALLIPFVFLLIYQYKHNIAWLFIPVFIYGLLMSSSFGGIIAALLAFLLFFIFAKKYKELTGFIVVFIIGSLLFIGIFGLPDVFEKRILNNQENFEIEEMGSLTIKLNLMKDSFDVISENKILGVGLGNYLEHVETEATVHNAYLLVWAEGGLLSIIGFLLILLSFGMGIFKHRANKIYFAAALSIYLALLLNFMTNVHFYNRYVLIGLFLLTILYPRDPVEESEKINLK